MAAALTEVIALNLHKNIEKAKNSYEFHHQNSPGSRYKFHIPARCVANLWERVCLYFSSGRQFANLDSGQDRSVARALGSPDPSQLSPLRPSHALHPPHCTPRPRAKKFVGRVRTGEEIAPMECRPDKRGPAGEREMPRAQVAADSPSPKTPPLCPARVPRPAACHSHSASFLWEHCSPGPMPAAATQCTHNRRFAMQT